MKHTTTLWYHSKNKTKSKRLVLLLSFVLGLSVGLHMILISIVLPFVVLAVCKKNSPNIKSFCTGLVLGIGIFLFIHSLLINGLLFSIASVDIFTVNSLNWSVNRGAILCFSIIVISIVGLILLFQKRNKKNSATIATAVCLFILGGTSYFFPILRSGHNSLVAEQINTPQRLKSYINAERFGVANIPLLYGQTYNAQLDIARPFLNTKPILTYDSDSLSYVEAHDGISNKLNYSSKFKTLFPRMYDAKSAGRYSQWTAIRGEVINHKVNDEIQRFLS